MNVADIIRLNARTRAESEALVVGDQHITYGRYQEDIERTAAALAGVGIGKGDRVAVLGRNSYEYTQLYWALARLGAILVPLSFWHRTAELTYALEDAEPSLLFAEPELWEPLGPAVRRLTFPVEVRKLPGQDGERSDWEAFIDAAASAEAPMPEIAPEDPHMILYTSGTTGRPKGAILSHGRTVRDAIAMAMHLGLKPTDTFMDYFPSFHVGNWDHLKLYMLVGARVVLLREFDAGRRLRRDRRAPPDRGPRRADDVPLAARPPAPRRRRPHLLPPRLLRRLRPQRPDATRSPTPSASPPAAPRWPTPTASPRAARSSPSARTSDLFTHWGSIGRAMVGVELALLDEDLNEVPQGDRRRDLHPRPAHERLLAQAGRDRGGVPRRLDAHRRHGGRRRGRLPDDRRPQEGHDPQRRPERLLEGSRRLASRCTRRSTTSPWSGSPTRSTRSWSAR